MRDVFVDALLRYAEGEDKFCLITADLGFGVFDEYSERFPEKFLNVGVAEQNMASVAAGMALEGWKVVAYSIGNFPTFRCLEQLRNDICYHDLDIKVVGMGAGFSYGILGMSHHATEDLAIVRALPNIKIYAPSGRWDAQEIIASMLNESGPAYLRLDKTAYEHQEDSLELVHGRATTIRYGDRVTLAALGGIVKEAMVAAELLASEGIEADVLAFHALRPFDGDSLAASVSRTGRLVTVEEHSAIGGLGSAAAEYCMEQGLGLSGFYRIGLRDTFSKVVGSADYLRAQYSMDACSIVSTVKEMLGVEASSGEADGGAVC